MAEDKTKKTDRRSDRPLLLACDLRGCPNRCKHCWLGDLPNQPMQAGDDEAIVSCFEPYFRKIAFYSWLREPDFTDDYRARWEKDRRLSRGIEPRRFELASFYRIVRDPEYVKFLKDVGTKKVQLTFFGLKETTDRYVGRKGAFDELIRAGEILIENGIAPRWQVFINEENKEEVVRLIAFAKQRKLFSRCAGFSLFVHEGSCDGNNRSLYDIRIQKAHVPEEVRPYYLDFENALSERECVRMLKESEARFVPHNGEEIVLNITSDGNVYFNFTAPSPLWKIGNFREDEAGEMVRRILEEDVLALRLARSVSLKELVRRFGREDSDRIFSLDDYQMYLLNEFLEEESRKR